VGCLPEGGEIVVVVPPEANPDVGLELAMGLSRAGRRVRLLARGATVASFVRKVTPETPMALAELDAYTLNDKGPFLKQLLPGVHAWVDTVYKGSIPFVDARRGVWASVISRLGLQELLDHCCLVAGILHHHPAATFVLSDPTWEPGVALCEGKGQVEQGKPQPGRLPSTRWFHSLSFLATGAACAIGVLAYRLKELWDESQLREHLKTLRPRQATPPKFWLSIVGHWEFSCRHLLQSVGAYVKENQVPVGILLQTSLKRQPVAGAKQAPVGEGPQLLPVLTSDPIGDCWTEVAQVVSYSSIWEFLIQAPSNLAAMLRCVYRASWLCPGVRIGSFELHPVLAKTRGLLLATTLDVLRGREAAAATLAFVNRRDVKGATVAMSHCSLVTDAVPDLVLQQAGATTCDIVHGALAELLDCVATAQSWSSYKLLWTVPEAEYVQPYVSSTCVAPFPARQWQFRGRSRGLAPDRPARLLLLTNYGTMLASAAHRKRFPRVGYQTLLIEAVRRVLAEMPASFEVLWRPHPGDDANLVRADASSHGAELQLSSAGLLEDDIEWADLVITSLSSVVVELLAWDKPILVHHIPLHEADVLMNLFAAERRFRNAEELRVALSRALADLRSAEGLHLEDELRRRMFGPEGRPGSAGEFYASAATRRRAEPEPASD
jgi:hypothetical protein